MAEDIEIKEVKSERSEAKVYELQDNDIYDGIYVMANILVNIQCSFFSNENGQIIVTDLSMLDINNVFERMLKCKLLPSTITCCKNNKFNLVIDKNIFSDESFKTFAFKEESGLLDLLRCIIIVHMNTDQEIIIDRNSGEIKVSKLTITKLNEAIHNLKTCNLKPLKINSKSEEGFEIVYVINKLQFTPEVTQNLSPNSSVRNDISINNKKRGRPRIYPEEFNMSNSGMHSKNNGIKRPRGRPSIKSIFSAECLTNNHIQQAQNAKNNSSFTSHASPNQLNNTNTSNNIQTERNKDLI